MKAQIPFASRLSAILALALMVSACVPVRLVRDQSQIDPLMLSDGNPALPQTVTPDCSFDYWLARAHSPDKTTLPCKPDKSNAAANVTAVTPVAAANLAALTPVSAEARRTEVQAELIAISDVKCRFYQAGIFGTQAGFNLGTSLSAAMFSGAASLLYGRAAKNLAAGSAFLSTTRATVNGEVYYNYIAPALLTEINAIRMDARRRMLAKSKCSSADYPAARAINDALNYHETCSYVVGLSSLLAKAGVQQRSGDPVQARNAQAFSAQLSVATTALAAAVATPEPAATADKEARNNKIEALRAEVARLKDIAWFVGTPETPTIGYAVDSFNQRLRVAAANVSAASELYEAESKKTPPNPPAIAAAKQQKDEAEKQLTAVKDQLIESINLDAEIAALIKKGGQDAAVASLQAKRAKLGDLNASLESAPVSCMD